MGHTLSQGKYDGKVFFDLQGHWHFVMGKDLRSTHDQGETYHPCHMEARGGVVTRI